MVKGTCPKCEAKDQYGDNCEVCGTTYKPVDLIDPYDTVSGKRPVLRETENLYVRLTEFADYLRRWVAAHVPQEAVRNFVGTWLDGGLEDWCISRDAPYFGFEIPGEPGKYFYVWLTRRLATSPQPRCGVRQTVATGWSFGDRKPTPASFM